MSDTAKKKTIEERMKSGDSISDKDIMNHVFVKYGLEREVDLFQKTVGGKLMTIINKVGIAKIKKKANIYVEKEIVSLVSHPDGNTNIIMKGTPVRMDKSGKEIERGEPTYASASPANHTPKMGYFVEVCEKRTDGRAVLKMEGLYDYAVYSEDEAAEFKQENKAPQGNGAHYGK